jgi:hypothetical protein
VEPSWIVASGIVVIAALPSQLSPQITGFLQSGIGITAVLALAVWLFRKRPILTAALLMLLFATNVNTAERFTPTINRDTVERPQRRKWLQEEVLSEDPHSIQERTEGPAILYDKVTEQESSQWHDEETLGQNPSAIQERPVPDYDDGYLSPYR